MVTLSVLSSKSLVKIFTIISKNYKEVNTRIMSEKFTATDAWNIPNVLACLKKSMGLAYYTRCGFDSLDDQTHVLTEKESDSVNKASENVDEVGSVNFEKTKRSHTAKSVIILRKKQIQNEVNNKVVSDLSKRKFVIHESSKRVGRIDLINFLRDTHKAKKSCKS